MNPRVYEFDAEIWRNPESTSAYIIFPYDLRTEFGRATPIKVHVTFDGEPYDCSIMNRGLKNFKKRPTYSINLRPEIMEKIGKIWGDTVHVTVQERDEDGRAGHWRHNTEMEVLYAMMKRRSVRKYTEEPIPQESITRILQAARLAPTSRNLKPWEFIVIRDKAVLQKLAGVKTMGSAMLKNADCAIVVTADREVSDVWIEDCAIAMTYMHLMAAAMGIGSCWVQCRLRNAKGGVDSEDYARELLGIPLQYGVAAILSLGTAAEEPAYRTLEELQPEKIHRERF